MASLAPILPQLGISFLGGYLKKHGYDVNAYDLQGACKAKAIETCMAYDIVGFSCYITNYKAVIVLATELKQMKPEIIIIAGGPHVTLNPEAFKNTEIDYLICGDGEIPLAELLKHLEKEEKPPHIRGVILLSDDNIFAAEKAEVITDLDRIGPPDTSFFDFEMYRPPPHVLGKKVIHTMTSRGCPFSCSFCAAAEVMGRKMRYRSIDSVVSELKIYKTNGFNSIMFYDDIFTLHKGRVKELCQKIIKEKIDIKWNCWSRTNTCQDIEMLKIMKEAGCYLLVFGCESIHDKTLKLLRKGLTCDDHRKALDLTNEVGIDTYASFMIGLPGENIDDIRASIDFAAKSSLLFATFTIFEPFQGTPVYDICKETGRWEKSDVEGDSNAILADQELVWIPNGMKRSEVVALSTKAFRDFYFYPPRTLKIVFQHLPKLPLERSFRFIKGGADYFIKSIRRKKSTSNTHF